MKIYSSPYTSVSFPDESIFTRLFQSPSPFSDNAPAFIDGASGRAVTRSELKQLALSLGWGMRNYFTTLGGIPLARGDTVMIFSPNSIAWPIMLFGSIAAGLKLTLANSSYGPAELKHQYTDSGAKAIFVHPTLIDTVLAMFDLTRISASEAKKNIIFADWGDRCPETGYVRMDDLLGRQSLKEEERFPGTQADETVYMCYSSGTTGLPKGVETSHRNMVSVVHIIKEGFPKVTSGVDVLLCCLPLYHIYGLTKVVHESLFLGLTVVIMPRFIPDDFCKYVEKYKVTMSLVVPPICLVLIHHPATTTYSMKTLNFLLSGAAPLGGPLVEALYKKLLSVGAHVDIVQGYGLTETSPTTHIGTREAFMTKVGSIGPLLPNLEARLVIDDIRDAKEGEPGELWLRGPTVMKGYLNNVAATNNAITPDKWFKTGDIAIRDKDGFYYIVDRRKELIKYKGFQVPPAELEAQLLQHPDIVDACVVGVYSEKDATELPRAYVVVKTPFKTAGDVTAFKRSIQKWIQTRVARHKHLRGGVAVIESVPKSAAGKLLRRQLRDRAQKEMEDQGKQISSKL